MTIIINLYVIISALFLITSHTVGLADKVIIASYILMEIWIAYVTQINLSRGLSLHFGMNSFVQLIIPTFLTILYFLNGFSLVFFSFN